MRNILVPAYSSTDEIYNLNLIQYSPRATLISNMTGSKGITSEKVIFDDPKDDKASICMSVVIV